jgi:hypothetical protein
MDVSREMKLLTVLAKAILDVTPRKLHLTFPTCSQLSSHAPCSSHQRAIAFALSSRTVFFMNASILQRENVLSPISITVNIAATTCHSAYSQPLKNLGKWHTNTTPSPLALVTTMITAAMGPPSTVTFVIGRSSPTATTQPPTWQLSGEPS